MEISPSQLAREWKAGRFQPFYYLCGEDEETKRAAVSFLKKGSDDFNYREFSKTESAGKAPEIISELLSLPVFSERRIIVVEIPESAAALKKGLADYVKGPAPSSILVLISEDSKPDIKDSLPRLILEKGAVCVFQKLKEKEAIEKLKSLAIKNGKTITHEAAEFIVLEIGTDLNILRQEIEKLCLFSSNQTLEMGEAALSLGYRKTSDPFALSRLIERRLKKETLSHLRSLWREGKPQERVFRALSQINATLSKQIKAKKMLAAKLGRNEIEKRLRLHPYWDKGFLEGLASFSETRIRRELRLCLETEARLKSQSWIDPAIETEELAKKICEP